MNKPRSVRRSEDKPKSAFKDGGKSLNCKTWRKTREIRVLAERNPAVVAAGAWVESGVEVQEHPAVQARIAEELHAETHREKEESLRRFQDAVRRRVSEQSRIRKQQQLQKSYRTAEQECRVVQQSCDSARCLSPQKPRYPTWPQGELAICGPNARRLTAREGKVSDDGDRHSRQLSRVMKQVRHRLAARQTVRDGQDLAELPGGTWRGSLTRDKPVGRVTDDDDEEEEEEEDEEDEISLAGQRDEPLCLQSHVSKTVTFPDDPGSARLATEERPISPSPHFRSGQVLWPKDDQEELKRQRQSQYVTYRRLFMDIEREQVKEHQRHKKHLRRIAKIKAEKEQQREDEERRMKHEERRKEMVERERLVLERLRLEEEELEEEERKRARAKKAKETTRYVEALRAQMKERLMLEKVELPPLCSCGESFWDSHPDTCANNCIFYNNPKGYAQVLHSVLLSSELNETCRSVAWKTRDAL